MFRAVPDASTRVANLVSGASDLVVSLDPDLAMQVEAAGGVEPRTALTERVGYLKLNPQKPGLDDVRLRRAIAHAIDRELIVEGLLGGFDSPVGQMLTPAHVGWVEGVEGVPYDPEAARALIEEMGDAADRTLSFATAPVFDQRIVQALQQMLTDVGFDVEIEMTDMSTYLSKVRGEPAQGPDLSFGRWSCALPGRRRRAPSAAALRQLLVVRARSPGRRRPLTPPARRSTRASGSPNTPRCTRTSPRRSRWCRSTRRRSSTAPDSRLGWTPTPNESLFINRMDWSD